VNGTPPPVAEISGSTSSSLVDRVKAQDPEAWRRFSTLYGPLVYHWARQSKLQSHDAADIVQEVFRKVASHIGGFRRDRAGDSFRGWLWTVTRNAIRDHFRDAAGRPEAVGGSEMRQRLEQLHERAPFDLEAGDPESGDAQPHRRLMQAAAELVRGEFEERTWQLFYSVAVDGRPASDVAADAGLSVWAVYKAKNRVLKRLQEDLGDAAEL